MKLEVKVKGFNANDAGDGWGLFYKGQKFFKDSDLYSFVQRINHS